ncbi:MAG: (2Fe-2S)-binding protein, partial [Bacteroidetes bacterium CG_4_10_14_3_um_filter_42_6]
MTNKIKIKIDGKEIITDQGKTIVEAAHENGIFIPTLCNFAGALPKGC